jgi:hypothetical protein
MPTKRITALTIIVFISFIHLTGQDGSIEIFVHDDYTGNPLGFALVSILQRGVLVDTAYTGINGIANLRTVTSMTEQEELPSSFSLSNNYPNPFREETKVEIGVPEAQTIRATVYNILGQRVISEQISVSAGYHTLNLSIAHLPTGVYFLNLQGTEQQTVKLLKLGSAMRYSGPMISVNGSRIHRGTVLARQSEGEYTIRVSKARYGTQEITTHITPGTSIDVPLSRNNRVTFIVVDEQNEQLTYRIHVGGEQLNRSFTAPGMLTLKSGIYTVSGQADGSVVDAQVEVVSRDTTFFIVTEEGDTSTEHFVASSVLISDALKRGEIDHETSLIYRAYALVGDPRLPVQYLGNMTYIEDGTALFVEILRNQDELSKEALDALAPFIVRPNDPISIYTTGFQDDEGVQKRILQSETWVSAPAANGFAKAWVPTSIDDENPAQQLAVKFASVIDEVWPILFGGNKLLNPPKKDTAGLPSTDVNPDAAIDIYFLNFNTVDPRLAVCLVNPVDSVCTLGGALGYAVPVAPFEGRKSSGYAVVDTRNWGVSDIDGPVSDWFVGTVAHELYHIGQFGYNSYETAWLMESTATWGEFTVLKELGRSAEEVRAFLPGFYHRINQRLHHVNGQHEYSAYLYPLFTQMERDRSIVEQVWNTVIAQAPQGVSAFDGHIPFRDNFREFALRNWNQDPVEPLYVTVDEGFPDWLVPPLAETLFLDMDAEITISANVQPLSAVYHLVTVNLEENAVNRLFIDLSRVTNNPDAGVDAIVTIEGKDPEIMHWSDESRVIFCLDDEDERVEEIILIISNASIDSPMPVVVKIDTEEVCPAFSGRVTYTRSVEGSFTNSSGRLEEWSENTSVVMDVELNYHEEYSRSNNQFVVTSGTVRWSLDRYNIEHDVNCSGEKKPLINESTGGGTYSVDEGVNLMSLYWRAGEFLQPDKDRYAISVGHTTVGLGTGAQYQYRSRTLLCDVWSDWTYSYLTFYIMDTILADIEDEDLLVDTWYHENTTGAIPIIRKLEWNLKRYKKE